MRIFQTASMDMETLTYREPLDRKPMESATNTSQLREVNQSYHSLLKLNFSIHQPGDNPGGGTHQCWLCIAATRHLIWHRTGRRKPFYLNAC